MNWKNQTCINFFYFLQVEFKFDGVQLIHIAENGINLFFALSLLKVYEKFKFMILFSLDCCLENKSNNPWKPRRSL